MKISFEEEKKEFQLGIGLYDVFITGGFSIQTEPGFVISVLNSSTGNFVQLKNTLRLRSREGGFKCVKMFRFEIEDAGNYLIQIVHPERIKVKASMLMTKNLFLPQPKFVDLNVLISRN